MSKVKRLFKVAKELNVGTTMLVDHLVKNGHQVENSPNAKIPGELYDLLLKEFASDKQMKEKAEQIIEKRNEDRFHHTTTKPEPPKPPKEEETPADFMSAAQLRASANSTPNPVPTAEPTTPVQEAEEVTTPSTTEVPVDPPTPAPKEEVESPVEPVVPEAKEVEEEKPAALKIVGKIDLDTINKKTSRPKKTHKTTSKPAPPAAKDTEPSTPKDPTPPPPAKEVPVVPEKPEPVAKEKEPESPPVVQKETPEVPASETAAPEEKKEPVKKEPKDLPEVTAEKVAPEKEAEQPAEPEAETEEVITADPKQLRGLKVLGKIDLADSSKKKGKDKKKDESKPTPANKDGNSDGDTSKRRRKRKRKRKKVTNEDVNSQNKKGSGDKKGKTAKEKPTKKEIQESIRNTFAQMQKGPSRGRQRLRRAKRDAGAARRRRDEEKVASESHVLEMTEFITANEFANLIEEPVNNIIKSCFDLGMMVTINQRLNADVLSLLAEEYGYDAKFIDVKEQEFEDAIEEDAPEDLRTRNPIITVMGHVDHGKTTLLDHLRKANVAAGEAGGITQHIGAYEVALKSGGKVTFLDTPGHEAFTAMRARGAQVTDVAIIVVAADDAVMPQTKEAINHSQAANVPMVFAINKVDKESADPERIKGQLAEMNILVEDWGGDFQSQEISAKMGTNVDELLEKVILQAELLELKANPDRIANGTVIEAKLDKGRGNVATMLVENGTLKVGDPMVAGIHFGKVRALINQNGERIKEAGPAMPIQVLGLNGQPNAGDRFQVFKEESKAKGVSQKRQELFREQSFRQKNRITLDEIGRRRALGSFNELNIIIKGDVDGSVEALAGSLLKLSTEEVQVNIILKSVGGITESDVNLASASDAIIIAFNTRPSAQARTLAEREEIDIRTYSVIYDAIGDVKDALEGLLSPDIKEEILGTAEVRDVFKITRVGSVAGCMVINGKIYRNSPVRVIRDGVVIYTSTISSLKRFKDDAKEVATGFECGIMIENYNDVKVGDHFEVYKEVEVKRTL